MIKRTDKVNYRLYRPSQWLTEATVSHRVGSKKKTEVRWKENQEQQSMSLRRGSLNAVTCLSSAATRQSLLDYVFISVSAESHWPAAVLCRPVRWTMVSLLRLWTDQDTVVTSFWPFCWDSLLLLLLRSSSSAPSLNISSRLCLLYYDHRCCLTVIK